MTPNHLIGNLIKFYCFPNLIADQSEKEVVICEIPLAT